MRIRIILILLCTVFLTNCASYDFRHRVVQQGNLLPASKIEQLKVGMSKEAVSTLLGASLVGPLFTNDRWDYAYTKRRGNSEMEKRILVLYFSANRLVKIEHNH